MKNGTVKICAALGFLFLVLFSVMGADKSRRENLVDTAKSFIGTRYVTGGKSASGFDCSGFVMYVYGRYNIKLPATSEGQYLAGKPVPLKDALAGDVVCFKIYGNRISHVGIYLGNSRFIHSPVPKKHVRIESIDMEYWKKRFFAAVRIEGLDD